MMNYRRGRLFLGNIYYSYKLAKIYYSANIKRSIYSILRGGIYLVKSLEINKVRIEGFKILCL